MWAAWGIAWGDSWGSSWGPLHEVEEKPFRFGMGYSKLDKFDQKQGPTVDEVQAAWDLLELRLKNGTKQEPIAQEAVEVQPQAVVAIEKPDTAAIEQEQQAIARRTRNKKAIALLLLEIA